MLRPRGTGAQPAETEEIDPPELHREKTWKAAQHKVNLVRTATSGRASNNALMRLYPDALRPDTGMGSIRFDASTRWPPSKFVRVSPVHSKAADVIDVLCDVWKLAPPCAVISLPPSFNRQSLASRVELVVARGLAEAALKTNAWIITSGYADGVGAHVAGNAMDFAHANLSGSARLCCIGIVPFESTHGHEALDAVGKNGVVHSFADLTLRATSVASPPSSPPPTPPAATEAEEDGANDTVTPIKVPMQQPPSLNMTVEHDADTAGSQHEHGSSTHPRQQDLNRHHTHFVMVDGVNAEPFRMRLEKYISDYDISGDEIQTPKVLLVVCGGEPGA